MIVTVTFNPAVDQTVQFDEPMEPDSVLRASDATFDAGGKGINVAQYLDALDCPCVATGILGGFTGSFIQSELEADGIEADFAAAGEPTRMNTTAIAAGEEYKLNQNGPDVTPEIVGEIVDRIRSYDPNLVTVGGSLPPGLTTAAIDDIATAGEWETIVDVGGDNLARLEATYALCKPNREELSAATGAAVSTIEECATAADTFRDHGFDRVLASLGSDGAVLATDDALYVADSLDVSVVDTVGAGDALLSGFVGAWENDADDETALRTGVAVSSLLVEQAGTAAPDFAELDELRAQVRVRRLDV